MLPPGIPELTLGWQILDWCSTVLAQPDGDRMGEPWVFYPEQAMFVLWFYSVDERGRFNYRRAVLERPKGYGKSPLMAAISCAELLGPTRFDRFEHVDVSAKHPLGIKAIGRQTPTPIVQIAATSDDTANNTMALVRQMLLEGRAEEFYPGLEVMLSKISAPGLRNLMKVTASPRGREGNRATFVICDETGLWVPAENGPKLYQVLSRNLAKMQGRLIETTNIPEPGEGSVAESSHETYEKMQGGTTFDRALLFDTKSVDCEDIYDPEQALPALRKLYGDTLIENGGHVDLEWIWAEINDPQQPEHVSRRFWFNQFVRPKSSWLKLQWWNDCRNNDIRLKKTDKIALGFKGTTKKGAAIVGTRLTDGATFLLGFWEKPEGADQLWEVPVLDVDAKIRKIVETHNVFKVCCDPQQYQDVIGRWSADHEDVFEEVWLSQKQQACRMVEQFETAVETKRLLWKDDNLSRHVLNSHMEPHPQGHSIRQETKYSERYIIAAQAAVLALEASVRAIEEGALTETDNTLYSW